MSNNTNRILEQGEGILWLAPAWVPRSFCIPGKRIKMHPADLYAFGAHRGGIDERWFSSTVRADNGPLTLPDEGLSYAVYGDAGHLQKVLFKDLVADLGAALVGSTLWEKYKGWPVYAKFFDNQGALPHHLHQMQAHAEKVGNRTKPEAYFFPSQYNNHGGDFPYTFFGLEPGTTTQDVKPIACSSVPAGTFPRAPCMPPAACARTNPSGAAIFTPCSNPWSIMSLWTTTS